jgi:transcription elongation factor Elf1
MIDISKQKVKIDCPACNSEIEVTMQQVADEMTLVCHCGQKIKLQDKDNSAKNGIKNFNKTFDDLNKTLKNFGK